VKRYSTVAIVLHWATAAAVALEIGLGWRRVAQPAALPGLHESVGLLIVLLTLVRIAWRVSARSVPNTDDVSWQSAVARGVHVGFYVALVALPLSGWLMVSAGDVGTMKVFGAVPWPLVTGISGHEALGDAAQETHRALTYVLYVLLTLHLAGALKHHVVRGPQWMTRMLPGTHRLLDWRLVTVIAMSTLTVVAGSGQIDTLLPMGLRNKLSPSTAARVIDGRRTPLFAGLVQPLLTDKCGSCHGATRQKGGLRLDTLEGLLKGGEGGKAVVVGSAEQSELIRRILLPSDHQHAMPPRGKPPLSVADGVILIWWIESGADTRATILGSKPPPVLESVLMERGVTSESRVFAEDVQHAASARIDSVERAGFVVRAVSSSGFVEVRPSSSIHTSHLDLAALSAISEQLVWLDLSGSAIGDDELKLLPTLPRLQRLSLARTRITGAGLAEMQHQPALEVLNLYGTEISDAAVTALAGLPALLTVYLDGTHITQRGVDALEKTHAGVRVIWGRPDDSINKGS
jgi:cytochrome b561